MKYYKERTKLVLDYFSRGYTMTQVSKELDLNYKLVESIKRRYKVQVNKEIRNFVNHHFLDEIDSDIKAYFLGFYIADGYMSPEGRIRFQISRDDEIILHKFKDCFGVNSIKYRNNQSGAKHRKEQAHYEFTSTIIRDMLKNKYNIKLKKTYDCTFEFPFETIPEELYGSFIRGL